jgi:hypothetical protein
MMNNATTQAKSARLMENLAMKSAPCCVAAEAAGAAAMQRTVRT